MGDPSKLYKLLGPRSDTKSWLDISSNFTLILRGSKSAKSNLDNLDFPH